MILLNGGKVVEASMQMLIFDPYKISLVPFKIGSCSHGKLAISSTVSVNLNEFNGLYAYGNIIVAPINLKAERIFYFIEDDESSSRNKISVQYVHEDGHTDLIYRVAIDGGKEGFKSFMLSHGVSAYNDIIFKDNDFALIQDMAILPPNTVSNNTNNRAIPIIKFLGHAKDKVTIKSIHRNGIATVQLAEQPNSDTFEIDLEFLTEVIPTFDRVR